MSIIPERQPNLFDRVFGAASNSDGIASLDPFADLGNEQAFAPFPIVARLSKTCACLRGPMIDSRADDRAHCLRCGRST